MKSSSIKPHRAAFECNAFFLARSSHPADCYCDRDFRSIGADAVQAQIFGNPTVVTVGRTGTQEMEAFQALLAAHW
jgi:hypothetical protein